jgi:hypothetical protein
MASPAATLPDNPDLLKAMLLAERAESERLRQIIRKRCLGGTFRSARGRVMFEAHARASTHVDFRT